MKKLNHLILLVALVAIASSCASVYKCGDPVPDKKPGNKRLQAVIAERDSLCISLDDEQRENASLTNQLSQMTGARNELSRNLQR